MHTAKINGQVNFGFWYTHVHVIQITEQVPEPHRHIQFAAAAGLHAGRVAVFTIMRSRQAPPGANPVFKIQGPHNASDINPMGTGPAAFRFVAEQAAPGFFLNSNHLLFQDVLPPILKKTYFLKLILMGIIFLNYNTETLLSKTAICRTKRKNPKSQSSGFFFCIGCSFFLTASSLR